MNYTPKPKPHPANVIPGTSGEHLHLLKQLPRLLNDSHRLGKPRRDDTLEWQRSPGG